MNKVKSVSITDLKGEIIVDVDHVWHIKNLDKISLSQFKELNKNKQPIETIFEAHGWKFRLYCNISQNIYNKEDEIGCFLNILEYGEGLTEKEILSQFQFEICCQFLDPPSNLSAQTWKLKGGFCEYPNFFNFDKIRNDVGTNALGYGYASMISRSMLGTKNKTTQIPFGVDLPIQCSIQIYQIKIRDHSSTSSNDINLNIITNIPYTKLSPYAKKMWKLLYDTKIKNKNDKENYNKTDATILLKNKKNKEIKDEKEEKDLVIGFEEDNDVTTLIIPVHQNLLSAISPVFQVAFSSVKTSSSSSLSVTNSLDLEKDSEIIIENVDEKIMKQLLQFIYTGHVNIIMNSDNIIDNNNNDIKEPQDKLEEIKEDYVTPLESWKEWVLLFEFANHYYVEELMEVCITALQSLISIENALFLMRFAKQLPQGHSPLLKKLAQSVLYFFHNLSDPNYQLALTVVSPIIKENKINDTNTRIKRQYISLKTDNSFEQNNNLSLNKKQCL